MQDPILVLSVDQNSLKIPLQDLTQTRMNERTRQIRKTTKGRKTATEKNDKK